ncbi:MAG: hypothetical protein C0404_05525 [Verrucomicrobia bacterium]|nr:hypothetical protein [Verrucomicrobiota bacterium]
MAKSTLVIVGPGGIGKSPIDGLVRRDVVRLDPYRLRLGGPRDSGDRLYAPPKIREEIAGVLGRFGDTAIVKKAGGETVEWYSKAGVVFFTVRGEWQCIVVPSDTGTLAKLEIYAPVLPTLLTIPEFVAALGNVSIVVLNPAPVALSLMKDWTDIKQRTWQNCKKRGDTDESAEKRAKSVTSEAPYWRELVGKHGAVEAVNWRFPEFVYKESPASLQQAKKHLLELDGTLGLFFQ